MAKKLKNCILFFLLMSFVIGCYQGRPSRKTPIHLNPNMDSQPKYKAQSESEFFSNGSTMRPPVEGTVARGYLREDSVLYQGRDARGNLIKKSPIATTSATLERGQQRYDIYCTPCHSAVGDGKGIIIQKGWPIPAPSFHEKRLVDESDGHFFDVISNGIRNMPGYAHQVQVEDRWAIVQYVRALQRSQSATLKDVPAALRQKLKAGDRP